MAKVVFCVQQIFELGGTEQVTIDLANRLAERGHDVEVISFAETKSRPCVYAFSEKVKLFSLDLPFDVLRFENVAPELLRKGRVFSFIGYGVKLLHHMFWKAFLHRRKLYERIQDGGVLIGTSLESYRFAPKKGRVIHEFHYDSKAFSKPFFRFLLWGMRKPDKWIFLSDTTLKAIQKRFPKLVGKSDFIHNPIRFPSEWHPEPHDHQLLFLGRYMPQKNPLLALEVAKCLRQRGFPFHLSMFGTGNLETDMKNYVKRWDLGDFVSIEPSTTDIKGRILQADLLLLTSKYEGWPLIIGEANALSCPVICNDFGPVAHEMVNEGENGYVIQSGKAEDFASKIEAIFVNQEELLRLRQGAFDHSQRFEAEAILRKWEELF